jgi:hypothetical protein
MLAGALAVALSPLLGAEALVAAAAASLLWGEETDSASTTRLRLRRCSDRAITPLAYFGFGLAILQTPALTEECQMFLVWFGGAPRAASAVFIMTLLGNPALYDADAAIMVSSLAVLFGIAAARLSSWPLTQHFLRQSARAVSAGSRGRWRARPAIASSEGDRRAAQSDSMLARWAQKWIPVLRAKARQINGLIIGRASLNRRRHADINFSLDQRDL